MATDARKPRMPDAVIIIPGIMGSALVDSESQQTLWGLNHVDWYVKAWTTGHSLDLLAVTEDELGGKVGRVRPAGLFRFPAFAPLLHGFEPYTGLVGGVTRVVAHPDALCEFSYDWRLSIEHNAKELAKAADRHLTRWRVHPQGSRDAQLVLVAHSMGGLVARYLTSVLGAAADVRATVTLGTPFFGAVKAAFILSTGRGAPVPLPRARLKRMTRTMPGLHDLLPFYRCVDDGASARLLTAGDVAALGGSHELAAQAMARHTLLMAGPHTTLRPLVGVEQPTMQSLTLRQGVVEPQFYACETGPAGGLSRVNRAGDSTVYRGAAAAFGLSPATLPQSHGALAQTEEAISHVRDVLTNDAAGPPLGLTVIGIDVPDLVTVEEPFPVTVSVDDPAGVSCRVFDAFSDRQVSWPPLLRKDGAVVAEVELPRPGVFRVEVKGGGSSAVSQQVMALPPGIPLVEEE